ncbi:MAG: hypothetical protein CMP61_08900 [Flavobacteriales bacterium]|nr:hypothetical protein [Flavobacteriales bacterium]|tara:strand:- start:763 stop:1191 length:429 start_codon:yes stop_codon:yes gene_type:complete
MTRGRRFFIFFSSAGIMTFFLLFTLSLRKDKPLEKYMSWLPNNKVISMVLEWRNAVNETYPKKIIFLEKAQDELEKLKLTQLEVTHALKDGDVEFMHDLTLPRQTPKQYYILIEINEIEYYTLVHVFPGKSEIIDFGIPSDD